ncbi:hypothetical protein NMY22_g5239 [Coprinellus aureogranulatus]|nr:hypothetical protein NMY22_g5239 [Coprinellus aureogranulatus]
MTSNVYLLHLGPLSHLKIELSQSADKDGAKTSLITNFHPAPVFCSICQEAFTDGDHRYDLFHSELEIMPAELEEPLLMILKPYSTLNAVGHSSISGEQWTFKTRSGRHPYPSIHHERRMPHGDPCRFPPLFILVALIPFCKFSPASERYDGRFTFLSQSSIMLASEWRSISEKLGRTRPLQPTEGKSGDSEENQYEYLESGYVY